MSEEKHNSYGRERISQRQVDELIGLARGICADEDINQTEVEFLQKWLAANVYISDQPLIRTLYARVSEMLADGVVSADEKTELLDTLLAFSDRDFELGETLKATTLPLCDPAPNLTFPGRAFCFTGTFNFGNRTLCEREVSVRGGESGSLTKKTHYLVIGTYATDSWVHSSFGRKIMKAVDMRDTGTPIAIISEQHWARHL